MGSYCTPDGPWPRIRCNVQLSGFLHNAGFVHTLSWIDLSINVEGSPTCPRRPHADCLELRPKVRKIFFSPDFDLGLLGLIRGSVEDGADTAEC